MAMLLVLPVLLSAGPARAADYLIGAEDVLQVSVYLHPELEHTVTVDANGSITLPPVGAIKAGGLTPRQLGDQISDRLSTYLRQTTAVTVTVTQYMSRSVFVTGQVSRPGRYGFEIIPSLPDAIAQAGGAIVGSDLSRVQVIRVEGTQRKTLYADVARVLRDGDTSALPALHAGDTVIVPQGIGAAAYAGQGVGGAIIGEVAHPGIYPVGEGQDLWTVLAGAGGVTANADLRNVRILTHQGDGYNAVRLDLRNILDNGSRAALTVKDGDVVYVPSNANSGLSRATIALVTVVGLTRDVLNILVLDQIYRGGQTK
ncbi:MAG: polysaccharide biosynthesis/export family protein [Candidatus Eisenbacteria bacterium]